MAAEATGMRARLMELSPQYCDVILGRWEAKTGQQATRHDGVTFNELQEARDGS